MKSRMMTSASVLGILSILIISGVCGVIANVDHHILNAGPYVDKIVFKVIESDEERVLALQAGEIEMDTSFIDPVYLPQLDADPDIDVFSTLRNGYGHITINCRDYPLNISGLRRAFAFAFDKTRVTEEIMDGFSQEHDSLVPRPNDWCVEEEFDWHYYTDQSDIGNEILDNLGFEVNNSTGYRHAPNGDSFDIVIEYAAASPEIAGGTAQIGVDALHALHIDAATLPNSFSEYGSPFDDYDMIFYATNFYNNDIDWLAYEYWSAYANWDYINPTNFRNETYDGWRDQLLFGTTYEEVFEASAEMQKILHYNVPRLVLYENTYMQSYRNDKFTGHVEDLANGIAGPWTTRKIQKLDGTFGGTVPIAISEEPDSFNIFTAESPASKAIFENLYSSLYNYGPDLKPIPDLVESMIIETHADNLNVPDDHTRFTIDIIQDATWSDGIPLTAEDVAFTFTYAYESAAYGNPAGTDLGNLVAAFAPTPYRVVIEFNTESYWHFSNFAFDYIIPEHIFNNDTGIGYQGWNTWNPVFDPDEPNVNYGPYQITDIEAGEFYELAYNSNFYYACRSFIFGVLGPMIDSPDDITYDLGSTGNEILWSFFDYNPTTYSIQMNGEEIVSDQIAGMLITQNVDGLEIGNYTFTLNATNDLGFSSNDSVLVSVVKPTDTSQVTLLIILITSISVVSIGVILTYAISIYRKKQTP